MKSKLKSGSMQLVLLAILGLTAVFSVAAFAAKENPVERPIVSVACKINPNDIACQTPKPEASLSPSTPNTSK